MESNNKKSLIGTLSLFICALIWGVTFGIQSKGMDYLQPFSFNGFRSIVGIIFSSIVIFIYYLKNKKKPNFFLIKNKKALIGSILCGVTLFLGTSTQQIGISMSTVGKSGFVSALYIFLVPFFGLFLKKKVAPKIWICVMVALVGLYLLCVKSGFTIEFGDLFLLLSTIGFAGQILIIDHISNDINPLLLSAIQFGVVAILSIFPIFIYEKPTFSGIIDGMPYLLFAGVLSSGIAYSLQNFGQKYSPSSVASLVLSLESVFAAFTGLFMGEVMNTKEYIGCLLIFSAIIISQINFRKKRKNVL
jgi:drug/metabolite transporter (DMT)-like permease